MSYLVICYVKLVKYKICTVSCAAPDLHILCCINYTFPFTAVMLTAAAASVHSI
jgi:hypothetical protein